MGDAFDRVRVRGAGDCATQWNVQQGYYGEDGHLLGAVRCFTDHGTAWIEWTRDDWHILAEAYRKDGDHTRLLQAWRRAGPVA